MGIPVLLALLVSLGCARRAPEPATAEHEAPGVASADELPSPPRREGTIVRADLLPVLDAGLGEFLGGVDTEPSLEGGRFVGWRITRLYPGDARFRDLPLQPGDVVTRVNGQTIERPEQAFSVWSGLRVASELAVEFFHDGERREMRYEIVD